LSRDSVTLAARNVTLGRLTSSSHNLGGADPANSAVTMLTTEMQLQTALLLLAAVTSLMTFNIYLLKFLLAAEGEITAWWSKVFTECPPKATVLQFFYKLFLHPCKGKYDTSS
jgi:hypothetical protein